MRDLEGRIAVVTGAASGIGRALGEELARKRCTLALVDVQEAELRETARRVESLGARAACFVADVSDRARMEALPGEVVDRFGAVHVLINNAGVTVGATFAEQSFDDLDWIIGINLWGVIYGCKFFLPHLARQDEAHIVNVSSMFGFLGFPGQSSYSVTKAGVRALTEALWTELADTNVGVTCVHPGSIRTNVIRSARIIDHEGQRRAIEMVDRYGKSAEATARKIVRAIETRRPRVLVGVDAHLLEWAKRLLPVRVHALMGAAYWRSASGGRARERVGSSPGGEPRSDVRQGEG